MSRKKQSDAEKKEQGTDPQGDTPLAVVGIGSSAGGLEALTQFFTAMPENSGLAFVLVSHLDPHHNSMLPELIQKKTRMPVQQITESMTVTTNQVYIIPPDKELAILHDTLQLLQRPPADRSHRPIDAFFRSLAQDRGNKAIGIVLSGTGTDGALGIRAIKEAGGLIIVQDEASAKFAGMPANAVATGLVDHILSPDKMPDQLLQFIRYSNKTLQERVLTEDEELDHSLQKIFILIRSVTGHDFSLYKKNTIRRRIERRMYVHQLETIDEYVNYLNESNREVFILFKELLIGVTSFFRDPEAFEILKTKYLPNLLLNKPDGYQFRIWIPGCSSGEEVYSIAIIVQECLQDLGRNINVQIFGTDLDEEAISVARAGIYLNSISIDVTPERLEKFFTLVDEHYQIKKNIRETVVFAEQNVIKDPPFTKLDMLCCRNLLIYFGPVLQEKLMPTFHYSLKEGGILFLGTSENIGRSADQFILLNKKWKIFERRSDPSSIAQLMELPKQKSLDRQPEENTALVAKATKDAGTIKLLKSILTQTEVPVCVVVDDKAELIYAHGRTGRFLEPAEGEASNNILDMARPGLKAGLTNAIRKMSSERTEIVINNLRVKTNGDFQDINLIVRPLPEIQKGLRGLMLIIFSEIPNVQDAEEEKVTKGLKETKDTAKRKIANNRDIKRLEDELRYTRENLQTTIEELETSNEELKSTNEELQSANEELQSTNKELETSKEELQSLNEEASTVNSELQGRIDDLVSANDDIKNLLDATDVATIFLDIDLKIRRFTPMVAKFFHLTATDIGRSIEHFATTLKKVDVKEHAQQVLRTLERYEEVIEDNEGQKYRMRVRPFRTVGNVIEGVVVTFLNVTEFNRMVETLADGEASWQGLVKNSPIATFVLTENVFSYINSSGNEMFGASSAEDLLGTSLYDRLHEDCRDRFLEEIGNPANDNQTVSIGEKKYIRKNGSGVLCEVFIKPLIFKGKKSTAVYCRQKQG